MSVAVITGASSGIGRALAILAVRAGYDVVGVGRNAGALEALAERVRVEGGRIATAALDVGDPASAKRIAALAHERFGRIDVLVANAGQVAAGPLAAQSDAALQAQYGTHAIGPVALVRESLTLLRENRGAVFLVGSGVARVPVGGLGAYAPSKAALRSSASILRRELRPAGISVTYVDPGVVDTAFMTRAGLAGAPAAIMATPETVARAILAAFRTRPRELNAVPWQTFFVALAERFPRLTDVLLERNPALVGTVPPALPAAAPVPAPAPEQSEPIEAPAPPALSFDDALAPVARRMERVKLSAQFVRSLLVADAELDPGEVALRWAGMPNKNERAATIEALDALAAAGFVAREGERYRVVREP